MKYVYVSYILLLSSIANSASANTLVVPTDYETIQLAIDAAIAGDIVSVEPGTYHESIDFLGKEITVSGSTGVPGNTILDGSQSSGSVVSFITGETNNSILIWNITTCSAMDIAQEVMVKQLKRMLIIISLMIQEVFAKKDVIKTLTVMDSNTILQLQLKKDAKIGIRQS